MPPRAEEVSKNEILLLCITFNHWSNSLEQELRLMSHFELHIAWKLIIIISLWLPLEHKLFLKARGIGFLKFIHVHIHTDTTPRVTHLWPSQPLFGLSHASCLGCYLHAKSQKENVNFNLSFLQTSQELDPVTLHNQALMNMEANPTQVQSDSNT